MTASTNATPRRRPIAAAQARGLVYLLELEAHQDAPATRAGLRHAIGRYATNAITALVNRGFVHRGRSERQDETFELTIAGTSVARELQRSRAVQ